ncbi:MAG: hypothetical protein MZV65_16010 [Chromatiales bacterium]|nr:hypothetical protein [Chromatiales bacterium]
MDIKDIIAPFAVWKRAFEKPFTVTQADRRAPRRAPVPGLPHQRRATRASAAAPARAICMNKAIDLVPVPGREASARATRASGPASTTAAAAGAPSASTSAPRAPWAMSNEYLWIDSRPRCLPLHARGGSQALGRRRTRLPPRRRLPPPRRWSGVPMPELDHAEAVEVLPRSS